MGCKHINYCDKSVSLTEVLKKCLADVELACYEQECCWNMQRKE